MTNKRTNDSCDQNIQITSSGMLEASLGALLQEERKKQKILIKDVASHLKIPDRYIVAIEANQYNKLPGKPFILGYLRTYAQMLNFDKDTVEQHLKTLFINNEKNFIISGMPKRHKKISPVMLFTLIFTAILLVIIALAGIWLYHHFLLGSMDTGLTKTSTEIIAGTNTSQLSTNKTIKTEDG